MQTLTRGEAAKEIGVAVPSLIYWEQKGELVPQKVTVGSKTLFAYSPKLIEKAREIFSRDNRKKRERNERRKVS